MRKANRQFPTINKAQTINRILSENGLATLDQAKSLMSQIGFLVNSHKTPERAFRDLLMATEPEKRYEAYNSLKQFITAFQVRALDSYVTEAKMEAERLQLPEWDDKTKEVREHGWHSEQEWARRVILREVRAQEAKGAITLVCRRCTFEQEFRAKDTDTARADAIAIGWQEERIWNAKKQAHEAKALCPQCVKQIKVN